MAFISIENLTTHYDTSKGKVHALEDVSFSLEKGQSVGIAGESACGKSTLGPVSYTHLTLPTNREV